MLDQITPEMILYMYLGIGVFAYISILTLTLRDLRIFKRTGYVSYRKGAFKGLVASTLVLFGIALMLWFARFTPLLGLAFVFIGVMVNNKGVREKVFTTAGAFNRFIGKTDILLTDDERRALYEQRITEKKQTQKEKEKAKRREKMKEQREKDEAEKP